MPQRVVRGGWGVGSGDVAPLLAGWPGEKKAIYAAAGVREYVLVDARARVLTVFVLAGSRYDSGVILGETQPWTSVTLPGLSLCLLDLLFE